MAAPALIQGRMIVRLLLGNTPISRTRVEGRGVTCREKSEHSKTAPRTTCGVPHGLLPEALGHSMAAPALIEGRMIAGLLLGNHPRSLELEWRGVV